MLGIRGWWRRAAVTPTYVTDCECRCRCHFDFVLCANLAMPSPVLSCPSSSSNHRHRNSSLSLPVSCLQCSGSWSPAFFFLSEGPGPGCRVTLHLAAAENVARLTYHLQTFSHVEPGIISIFSVIAPLNTPLENLQKAQRPQKPVKPPLQEKQSAVVPPNEPKCLVGCHQCGSQEVSQKIA